MRRRWIARRTRSRAARTSWGRPSTRCSTASRRESRTSCRRRSCSRTWGSSTWGRSTGTISPPRRRPCASRRISAARWWSTSSPVRGWATSTPRTTRRTRCTPPGSSIPRPESRCRPPPPWTGRRSSPRNCVRSVPNAMTSWPSRPRWPGRPVWPRSGSGSRNGCTTWVSPSSTPWPRRQGSRSVGCTPSSRSIRPSSTGRSTSCSWTSRYSDNRSPWSWTGPASPARTVRATTGCGTCRSPASSPGYAWPLPGTRPPSGRNCARRWPSTTVRPSSGFRRGRSVMLCPPSPRPRTGSTACTDPVTPRSSSSRWGRWSRPPSPPPVPSGQRASRST